MKEMIGAVFRLGSVFLGSFFLAMAIVPLVMWGCLLATVNYSGPGNLTLPSMTEMSIHNLLYSVELGTGLLLLRAGLR